MLQEKNKTDFQAIINMPSKGKYIDLRAVRKAIDNLTKEGKDIPVQGTIDLIINEQLPDMDFEQLCSYLTIKFKEK